MMPSHMLINSLAQHTKAEHYLEIGVFQGVTFFGVDIPHKVAVDPHFRFDPKEHETPAVEFFQMTSDDFFRSFGASDPQSTPATTAKSKVYFDIIYIDGLHTFDQSFRDFKNSLAFAHEKTIWVLDDTVPCDPYSAVPDQEKAKIFRQAAGFLSAGVWHGDVFKTVFAIHDHYPEFSYCTLLEGNPQTVVWRHANNAGKGRIPAFSSLEEIDRLDYFAMLDHAALLMPAAKNDCFDLIGNYHDPASRITPIVDNFLIQRRLKTLHARELKKAKSQIEELTRQQSTNTLQESMQICRTNLKKTQGKLKKTQRKLERMRNSLSWRITAPLRVFDKDV